MNKKINTLKHLPEIYHTIREIQQITQTEDSEFIQLNDWNEKDRNDAFIMTASDKSLKIWEREIGIRADETNETTEFRRKRLINRYTLKPPFTMHWLEEQLKELMGDGFIRIERDEKILHLIIYVDISSFPLLLEFEATIEAVLPLTMNLEKRMETKRELQENQWLGMATSSHLHYDIMMV